MAGQRSVVYVSRRLFENLLQVLAQRVDLNSLLQAVATSELSRRSRHKKVEWKLVAELLSRFEFEVSDPAATEALGEALCGLQRGRLRRRLARLVVNPSVLYRRQLHKRLRRQLPLLASRIDVLEDGRLRIACAIPEPHRACPQLFRLATGFLRAAPGLIGLPEAVVTAQVQPARADFLVVLPLSGTLWARLVRALRALFFAGPTEELLRASAQHLDRDQVELRAAFAVIEENEARHRALVENAPDIVIELTYEGLIEYASPSLEDRTGYRPEEMIGSHLMDWCHPHDIDQAKRHFELGPPGGGQARPRFRLRHRTEDWIWVESDSRAYRDVEGERRLVATLRDVTRRVELDRERHWRRLNLEAELRSRTEQLAERDVLLGELRRMLQPGEAPPNRRP